MRAAQFLHVCHRAVEIHIEESDAFDDGNGTLPKESCLISAGRERDAPRLYAGQHTAAAGTEGLRDLAVYDT